MNPIFAAAAFGLVKGLVSRRSARLPQVQLGDHLGQRFSGALREEVQFRLMPHLVSGGGNAPGSSALPFAVAHADPQDHSGANLYRIADAAAGGMLYESAFRSFGLLGAVAAHLAHNLVLDAAQGRLTQGRLTQGQLVRKKVPR